MDTGAGLSTIVLFAWYVCRRITSCGKALPSPHVLAAVTILGCFLPIGMNTPYPAPPLTLTTFPSLRDFDQAPCYGARPRMEPDRVGFTPMRIIVLAGRVFLPATLFHSSFLLVFRLVSCMNIKPR